jgi:hypothetical protein
VVGVVDGVAVVAFLLTPVLVVVVVLDPDEAAVVVVDGVAAAEDACCALEPAAAEVLAAEDVGVRAGPAEAAMAPTIAIVAEALATPAARLARRAGWRRRVMRRFIQLCSVRYRRPGNRAFTLPAVPLRPLGTSSDVALISAPRSAQRLAANGSAGVLAVLSGGAQQRTPE